MYVFDLVNIYKGVFGNPYKIDVTGEPKPIANDTPFAVVENFRSRGSIDYTTKGIALNKIGLYGYDIWHPVSFWKSRSKVIDIEACTVAVNLTKTIIKTAVSERKGTVHEQFNTDDYRFTIKGLLIGKGQMFPEDQIVKLKEIFETLEPVELHGGYPELFLDESCRVVVTQLDFPEVQGKTPWIRPFTLTCESDFIQDLILP